jgi:regulator of protease activity HflC (stomatin/prohibitin superfamily)
MSFPVKLDLKPLNSWTSGSDSGQAVSVEGMVLFVILMVLGLVGLAITNSPVFLLIALLVGGYLLLAVKVAKQWQKVAILRLGRYTGLRGPGIFFVIPVIDRVGGFVDQRIRVTSASAESAMTRDTVPVNVDAIVFWVVWDAEKCVLEVEDFHDAVQLSAQTALRESIGRHELAQMITERETLGKELQRILDEKTNPWGITVQSVEIRDVHIPAALEDAMSRQAQAERERQARIILGTAETEIAAKFAEAAVVYRDNPVALHLRAMNMLYEAIKEKGAMVIVPSSAVETMGLGGMLATTVLNPSLNPASAGHPAV